MKSLTFILLFLFNTGLKGNSQDFVSSGKVNLLISNVNIWEEYKNEVQQELDKKKFLFEARDEFETSAEYSLRLDKATAYREEVFGRFQKKHKEIIEDRIKQSHKRVRLKIDELGRYNADSQFFPVTINDQTKNIKITRDEARHFRKHLDTIQVLAEQQLTEDGETSRLFNLKIINPVNGAEYFFSDQIEQPLFASASGGTVIEGIPELRLAKIDFTEPSGNNYLDAREKGFFTVTLENEGDGIAEDINIKVECNTEEHLTYTKRVQISSLLPGKSIQGIIELGANQQIEGKEREFTFSFTEARGFNPPPSKYTIETKPFLPPQLIYTQLQVKELNPQKLNGKIEKMEEIEVDLRVKNIGTGIAENAYSKIEFNSTAGIFPTRSTVTEEFHLGDLKPGESIPVSFSFIVTNQYTGDKLLPIHIKIFEKGGNLAHGGDFSLGLELGKGTPEVPPDFLADVDKNIPKTGLLNNHIYALVIGNENYSIYNPGISRETDVEYAINDASVFTKYLVNTLGVRKSHINSGGNFLTKNATGKMIEQGLKWLSGMAKADTAACLVFYYAGHGIPDPVTHDAYLVPVDVSGNNFKDGIRLDDIFASLAANKPKKAIVFLDACFSGGGRNEGLLADNRSLRVKPKNNIIPGNGVVISSSSGTETSSPYHEGQHGLFTYYLLKKLKETAGNVTLGELTDYISSEVTKVSYLKNQPQTPTVKWNRQIANDWRDWKIE